MNNISTDFWAHVEREYVRISSLPTVGAVLTKLRNELPPELSFHSVAHTEEVVHEALLFALHDGLPERMRDVLAVAAVFHDSGFLFQRDGHEQRGAEFAQQSLSSEGSWSAEEISRIVAAICDTKLVMTESGLRQVPTNQVSQYLADADTSNFGRDDFFSKLELGRQEFGLADLAYLKKTYELVRCHRWYTEGGRALRQQQKEINLKRLLAMIEAD